MCEKKHPGRPDPASQDEKLVHNLRRSGHYLRHHTEEKGSQRRVLNLLSHRGPMTQKDLLDILCIRAGSLSELLSKLEAKGCIIKEKSETDKRNYNVSITEAGLQTLNELQQQYKDSMTALLVGFPEEDKAELNRLLDKLNAIWQERP